MSSRKQGEGSKDAKSAGAPPSCPEVSSNSPAVFASPSRPEVTSLSEPLLLSGIVVTVGALALACVT